MNLHFRQLIFSCLVAVAFLPALAQDAASSKDSTATMRDNLAKRLPQLGDVVEVRPSPIAGLFEIRVNESDIYYTDSKGNYLIEGQLIDTRQRRNLTKEREEKLSAINFQSLPFRDAFTIVRGNGERKIAIFEDPNCGYCKRFERDLQKVDNVTIEVFLFPILGADSVEKARNIWCSNDKGKTWQDWMVREQGIAPATPCDVGALARNVELGRKYKINGTPTLVFMDGSRTPGAIEASEVERRLAAIKS